jgi:hypothetical protein
VTVSSWLSTPREKERGGRGWPTDGLGHGNSWDADVLKEAAVMRVSAGGGPTGGGGGAGSSANTGFSYWVIRSLERERVTTGLLADLGAREGKYGAMATKPKEPGQELYALGAYQG